MNYFFLSCSIEEIANSHSQALSALFRLNAAFPTGILCDFPVMVSVTNGEFFFYAIT